MTVTCPDCGRDDLPTTGDVIPLHMTRRADSDDPVRMSWCTPSTPSDPNLPVIVATAYETEVEGKRVVIVRNSGAWLARRGEQYVREDTAGQPTWRYKRFTLYETAHEAAVAANAAPRRGEGIRDGWWSDDRW